MQIYIGTSGWHYNDWIGAFYPRSITGYHELAYHARHFNTVENNSSFYRIAGEGTYKTWDRMTPQDYLFSIKLNKLITHTHRLSLLPEVIEKVHYILDTTRVLESKRGAILIQLPASFREPIEQLQAFLEFFTGAVRAQAHPFDIAIEFRHDRWFTPVTFAFLQAHNVALVAGDSSRWPGIRHVTADVAYIRMHGPAKLFASSYTTLQLAELASYIRALPASTKRVYVYFNNDFHGYALDNANELMGLLGIEPPAAVT